MDIDPQVTDFPVRLLIVQNSRWSIDKIISYSFTVISYSHAGAAGQELPCIQRHFKHQEEAVSDLDWVQLFWEQPGINLTRNLVLSRITLTEELPWTKCLLSMRSCQEQVHFIETFGENKKIKRLLKHLILRQSKYFVSVRQIAFFECNIIKANYISIK